jgi:putative acetyltransferase
MSLQQDVSKVSADDFPRILEVWETSVRATHHFLSEADIQFIKPLIPDALSQVAELACVRDDAGQVAGFVGVENDKLEMLFIHPMWRGQGVGSRLLRYAINVLGAQLVDVNEQNEQAVVFYLRRGFKVEGRSELDSTGKPFPLLHMRLGNSLIVDIIGS